MVRAPAGGPLLRGTERLHFGIKVQGRGTIFSRGGVGDSVGTGGCFLGVSVNLAQRSIPLGGTACGSISKAAEVLTAVVFAKTPIISDIKNRCFYIYICYDCPSKRSTAWAEPCL